jgi:surface antigen
MPELRNLLPIRAKDAFLSLPKEVKVSLGLGALLFVPLLVVLMVSAVNAFIRPAAASYAYGISEEYGDDHAYYCKHLAMSGAKMPIICQAPEMFASAFISGYAGYSPTTRYAGDQYAFGNCTYWAALRRAQMGRPVPNTWGDAVYWAGRAELGGYAVDHTPARGAIMQTSWGSGHVAYVESVDANGTWHISEMNVVGFNKVDYRAMPPAAAGRYEFIH